MDHKVNVPHHAHLHRDRATGQALVHQRRRPDSAANAGAGPAHRLEGVVSESENQSIFRKQYIAGEHEDRQLLPQYVLIFGRKREFERSYGRHERPDRLRKKRDFMRRENEFFMTFDSLRPDAQDSDHLTLRMSSDGPRVLAVPPTFTTGPSTQDDAQPLGSIEDALSRTPLITDARRAHIGRRWEHWRNEDDSAKIRELQLGE